MSGSHPTQNASGTDARNQPDDQAPPFDHVFHDEDADVVVRSSDYVTFKIHRALLAKSSHFFKAMFTLPQSPPGTGDANNQDLIDGLPSFPVPENAEVVDLLLRYCYPMRDPEITSLPTFFAVLDAAIEYDIEYVLDELRRAWPRLAEEDPLRAFAMAFHRRQHWHNEARIAARLSLEKPIWPLEPPLPIEVKTIDADTIVRLMSYQRKCGTAARKLAENREWGLQMLDAQTCEHCSRKYKTQSQGLQITDWFGMFMKLVGPALLDRPCAKTVRDPDLLHSSIVNSYQTPRCELPMHSVERINYIVDLFANEIDKIVSDVTLDLEL